MRPKHLRNTFGQIRRPGILADVISPLDLRGGSRSSPPPAAAPAPAPAHEPIETPHQVDPTPKEPGEYRPGETRKEWRARQRARSVPDILKEREERKWKLPPVWIPPEPGKAQDWAREERLAELELERRDRLEDEERLRRERSAAQARTGHQQNPHVPCPRGFVRLPFWRGGNCVRAGSGGISLALGAVVAGLVLVIALDR